MATIDYEKKYKEALERAKGLIDFCSDSELKTLENVFPELRDSEDERIRKWIKNELESKYVVDNIVNNVMADKALAWLERQGEQKPAWSEWDRILQDSSISYLCNLRDTFETKGWDKEQIQKCISWLQSLGPNRGWKPSDEQMEAIRIAAEVGTANDSWAMNILRGIYNDLKN